MRFAVPVVLFSCFLLSACYPKHAWKVDAVLAREKAVLQDAMKGYIDTAGVAKLLEAYEQFAERYPSDPRSAEFLYKAADFYRYMRKPLRSIEMYNRIYENFPDYNKRPYMLFLQGFIYENEVGNMQAASIKYHEFLQKHPDHPMAKDVKLSLENLGKSPEKLLKDIQEKNRADSLAAARPNS